MNKFDKLYLRLAEEVSQLSYCDKLKVGAIISKDRMIISEGYNGTPSGFENVCEDGGKTKAYVLHAEANAILKCAKHGRSCNNATIYCTHSPCMDCAKLIYQAGIRKVFYITDYRSMDGVNFLKNSGVEIWKR